MNVFEFLRDKGVFKTAGIVFLFFFVLLLLVVVVQPLFVPSTMIPTGGWLEWWRFILFPSIGLALFAGLADAISEFFKSRHHRAKPV